MREKDRTYKINYKGIELKIERLPSGKFKKPNLAQFTTQGRSCTWLDDCRIPFTGMNDTPQGGYGRMDIRYGKPGETQPMSDGRNLWGKKATKIVEVDEPPMRKTTKRQPRSEDNVFKTSGFKSEENDTADASPMGRFAANLLVSDRILDQGKTTKSSGGRSYQNTNDMYSGGWAHKDEGFAEDPGYGDEGDFSRYFSLDEWWKRYFNELPEEVQKTFPFLIVPKASKREKSDGIKDGKNIHPTCKPLTLFSYLLVLGSRKGDIVLDPFAGSGTTGIAAVMGERNYIMIEREKEYFEIMEARIEKAKNPAGLVEHDFWQ